MSEHARESTSAIEGPDGQIAIAPPPGEIVDTYPETGWTEGTFSVNDSGAAEYDIPLWVPDARRGHKPALSLHYNSSAGNGYLGVGWSLAGLSTIRPCPRTINQDGRHENVGFVGDDALCLDGQRLRETAPTSPSGQREYRAENDSFTRIMSYAANAASQPTSLKAWTKDGRILTFGARMRAYTLLGAQPEDPILIRPLPERVTVAWGLSRIEDRNGNAIEITYEDEEFETENWVVEFRPRKIVYGPGRQIDLLYEDPRVRPDIIDTFIPGRSGSVHTNIRSRLGTIRMSADGDPLREYRLAYAENHSTTGASLLTSVAECDGGDPQVCLKPVEFEWSTGSFIFDEIDTPIRDVGTGGSRRRGFHVMDVNGDGMDDILYADPEDRWKWRLGNGIDGFGPAVDTGLRAEPHRQPWARPIDYDRDGRSDVLLSNYSPVAESAHATLWRSTGTDLELRKSLPAFYSSASGDGIFSALFADLDGDGRSDLVKPFVHTSGAYERTLTWFYQRNTAPANRYEEFAEEEGGDLVTDGTGVINPLFNLRVFSADGLASQILAWDEPESRYQMIYLDDQVLRARDVNLPFSKLPENEWGDRSNLHFADINGDGLEDAIYPITGLSYQMNSGSGFSAVMNRGGGSLYRGPEPVVPGQANNVRIADFTGDGADDVLLLHPGKPTDDTDFRQGLQLYTWKPGGFRRIPLRHAAAPFDISRQAVQPIDINGDGLMDLAQIWKETEDGQEFLRILKRRPEASSGEAYSSQPDKLLRVKVFEVGQRVQIAYGTLGGLATVERHFPCSGGYPVLCLRRGGSLVTQHTVENLDAATAGRRFHHTYWGARADALGGGWLGFEKHSVYDVERRTTTSKEFDNGSSVTVDGPSGPVVVYPYAGRPKKVETVADAPSTSTDQYVRTTTLDHEVRPGAVPGTYVVDLGSMSQLEREDLDLDGAWELLYLRDQTFEYDDFSNARRVVTTTVGSGGEPRPDSTRVDETTYTNLTDDRWLIGKPDLRVSTDCTHPDTPDQACVTRTTDHDYDAATGNLTDVIVEPDDPTLRLHTEIGYGSYGNIASITSSDANGESRGSRVTYDERDLYPREAFNALDHKTTVNIHGSLGVILDRTDENGVPTTMKYDRFGRLREVNHADGFFERYERIGTTLQIVRIPDGSGDSIIREMTTTDTLGRPVRHDVLVFNGSFSSVTTTYDPIGRVHTVSRPFTWIEAPEHFTTFTYDQRDRLLETTRPDGQTVRHEYRGRDTYTIDAMEGESFIRRRLDGAIEARYEDDPESDDWLRTQFTYKPFGQIGSIIAADGTVQSMEYDRLGRRTSLIDPTTGTTTTTYNAFGETTTETDANGDVSEYRYDDLGRVTRAISADGEAIYKWDTAPKGIGKPVNSKSTDGVGISYRYDVLGRPYTTTWTVENESHEFAYSYDGLGRLETVTYPRVHVPGQPDSRFKISHVYRRNGALAAVKDAAFPNQLPLWAAEDKNTADQLIWERYGNGVGTHYAYQPTTGLLSDIDSFLPGQPLRLAEIDYGYDFNGNVTERIDAFNGRSESYGYDGLNRLTSWSAGNGLTLLLALYDYDAVGNLKTESTTGVPGQDAIYGHGENGAPPHALTSRNGLRYGYDAAGRQTTGPNREVIYNRLNLPKTMTWGIDQGPGKVTRFLYDADGSRVLKRDPDQTVLSVGGLFERRTPAGTGGTQIHNVHNVVANGRTVAQMIWAQPLAGGAITPKRYFLHADGQGSTTYVTNDAGDVISNDAFLGALSIDLGHLYYDPWGRRIDSNFEPLGHNRHGGPKQGYTGHEHEDEYGLINMKGRIYDPRARRFLTPDPFIPSPLSSQSYNRYAYVLNNPVTLVDPSGYWPIESWDMGLCYIVSCTGGDDTGPGGGGGDFGSKGDPTEGIRSGAQQDTSKPRPRAPTADDAAETDSSGSWREPNSDLAPWEAGAEAFAEMMGYNDFRGESEEESDAFGIVTAFGWLMGEQNSWAPEHGTVTTSRMGFWENAGKTALGAAILAGPFRGGRGGGRGAIESKLGEPLAARGATQVAGQGFRSFSAFKRAMGPAGPRQAWHHVVEQTPGNVARFGPEAIHNTANLMRLPHGAGSIHARVSGLYSSIRPAITGSETLTVRQWLSTQSFGAQSTFGQRAIENITKGLW